MSISIDQLTQDLIEQKLLDEKDIRSVCPEGRGPEQFESAKKLAEALYAAEKLTKFQANVALAGKSHLLVIGDYHILKKVAEGGMGQVFKAQHRLMKRVVAIKVLSKAATQSKTSVQRFYREVESAAKLTHPNIVTAYDAGEHSSGLYFVMEYVSGIDLAELLKKKGQLPWHTVLNFIIQAAKGLAYAHNNGMTHRDIKPANLLLDQSGAVKILDMGLVKVEQAEEAELQEQSEEGLTAEGRLVGTVEYMSPEHVVNPKSADHRSDIYSLGCTMFRLMTGVLPFKGKTPMETAIAQRENPIPKLADHMGFVPEGLQEVLNGMLAKNPDHRYQSMEEVINDLQTIYIQAGEWDAHEGDPGDSATMLTMAAGFSEDPSKSGMIPIAGPRGDSDSSANFGSATARLLEGRRRSTKGRTASQEAGAVQEETHRKKRWPLVAGAAAVVVLALVLGLLVVGGGNDAPPDDPTVAKGPQNSNGGNGPGPNPTGTKTPRPGPPRTSPPRPASSDPNRPWFHWSLDGNGDDAASGRHGTLSGRVFQTPGRIGSAIQLVGTGHLQVPHHTGFNEIRKQMTVSCWVQLPTNHQQARSAGIVTKGTDAWRLTLAGSDDGRFRFAVGGDGPFNGKSVESPKSESFNDGRWHHVAGVYDGRNLILYVDGKEKNREDYDQFIPTNHAPITIGTNASDPLVQRLYGSVDDLRIFGAALDPAQVRTLSSMGKPAVAGRGQILQEFWTNQTALSPRQLRSILLSRKKPDHRYLLRSFATQRNIGDRYIQRVRGHIHPVVSGRYVFWINGDERAALFLSTSSSPLKKRPIASVRRATRPNVWDQPGQKSEPIQLEADQTYYIEAIQAEATGKDHLVVGWTLPDGTTQRPIPGLYLSPPKGHRLMPNLGPAPARPLDDGTVATPEPTPEPPSPPKPARPLKSLQAGQWLTMMPMLYPPQDAHAGAWRLVNQKLLGAPEDDKPLIKHVVPIRAVGSYEFEVHFRCTEGNNDVVTILPVADRFVSVVLGGYPDGNGVRHAGLQRIKGYDVGDAQNPTRRKLSLEANRLYRQRIRTTLNNENQTVEVEVRLEDLPIIRWSGPVSDLSQAEAWKLPTHSFGVGAYATKVVFESIRFKPLDGRINFLRTPPQSIAETANPPKPTDPAPPDPPQPDPPKPVTKPLDDKPPAEVFAEQFAEKVKAAKESADPTDNASLARLMLEAARTQTDSKQLKALLCEAALDLTLQLADETDLAVEAAERLAESDPEQAPLARSRAALLLKTRFIRSR
ncbi:MAG: protein kinase, partial [Phycisphaeraceae bacterium]|nr:protein kinase [Phycisphaeraceae bacterium]